jgi:hypothetical protein
MSKFPFAGTYVKGVLKLIVRVSPKAHGRARLPLNTVVLFDPTFAEKLEERVFQSAEVVDSAIVHVPDGKLVAPELA